MERNGFLIFEPETGVGKGKGGGRAKKVVPVDEVKVNSRIWISGATATEFDIKADALFRMGYHAATKQLAMIDVTDATVKGIVKATKMRRSNTLNVGIKQFVDTHSVRPGIYKLAVHPEDDSILVLTFDRALPVPKAKATTAPVETTSTETGTNGTAPASGVPTVVAEGNTKKVVKAGSPATAGVA